MTDSVIRAIHRDGALEIGAVEGPGEEGTWRPFARLSAQQADAFQAEFLKARAQIPAPVLPENMQRYLVRSNCEYSIVVEAERNNPEAAIMKAQETPYERWEQAWSKDEVDEEFRG